MAVSARREHLIDTALVLFAERGYHATGIDTILGRARISKKTLYRHFRSKDELILAALKKYDGLFRNSFMRQVEARTEDPRERLLAIYDVAGEWFVQDDFFGCIYIKATSEFSAPDTPIRKACQEFKAMIRGFIEDLCEQAGAPDPVALAAELAIVLEGAIVTAQIAQDRSQAAKIARSAATVLIDKTMPRN